MSQRSGFQQSHGEKVVKDIRRATRKQCSAEEKIRIVDVVLPINPTEVFRPRFLEGVKNAGEKREA